MPENKNLVTDLNVTVKTLVETAKDLTARISNDIRDLYEKINALREEVARLNAHDIHDKAAIKRLEKNIYELQAKFTSLLSEVIREDDIKDLLKSIGDVEGYILTEKGRALAEKARKKEDFRKKVLQLLAAGLAGGALGGGTVELVQVLMGALG